MLKPTLAICAIAALMTISGARAQAPPAATPPAATPAAPAPVPEAMPWNVPYGTPIRIELPKEPLGNQRTQKDLCLFQGKHW